MSSTEKDRKILEKPNSIPWPPIVLVICIISGFLLGTLYPLVWAPSPISDFLFALGLLLFLAAIYLYYASFSIFKTHATTISPVRAASALVTNGPFALSRNPIYLANVVATVALGLMFENLWLLGLAFVLAILLHRLAILPEERHLQLKFGKQWRTYKKKVRRWI